MTWLLLEFALLRSLRGVFQLYSLTFHCQGHSPGLKDQKTEKAHLPEWVETKPSDFAHAAAFVSVYKTYDPQIRTDFRANMRNILQDFVAPAHGIANKGSSVAHCFSSETNVSGISFHCVYNNHAVTFTISK